MDALIKELEELSQKCNDAENKFAKEDVQKVLSDLTNAVDEIEHSWSGSWIGYHANVYYEEFQNPPIGEHFSSEWGLMSGMSNPTSSEWVEYSYLNVYNHLMAKCNNPDLKKIETLFILSEKLLFNYRDEVITTVEALLTNGNDNFLEDRKRELNLVKTFHQEDLIKKYAPSQMLSRDSLAVSQGLRPPPHISLMSLLLSYFSPLSGLKELDSIIRKTVLYLRKKQKINQLPMTTSAKIFIGHGRSQLWRELGDFLQNRLNLKIDEFNREPVAGFTTVQRLTQLLDGVGFAFLLMTAEDEHMDNSLHARENVIHEIGLFQGRLGFTKAIVLLEEECKEFSNIQGLSQIRFSKNNIKSAFEDVRGVLEREGII